MGQIGSLSEKVPVTSEIRLAEALKHVNELPDKTDRCNASAILNRLLITSRQPRGYTSSHIQATKAVLDFMALHGINYISEKESNNGLQQAVVAV